MSKAAGKKPRKADREKTGGRRPRESGASDGAVLRFTRKNYLFLAAGCAIITIGYLLLARGSITLAPILLILGYCVLIPVAIMLK